MRSTLSTSQIWNADVLVNRPGGGWRDLGCGFCRQESTVQPQQGAGDGQLFCTWVVTRWEAPGESSPLLSSGPGQICGLNPCLTSLWPLPTSPKPSAWLPAAGTGYGAASPPKTFQFPLSPSLRRCPLLPSEELVRAKAQLQSAVRHPTCPFLPQPSRGKVYQIITPLV